MLDSEGYINKRGGMAITNKDMGLLKVVRAVAVSLGHKAYINGPYPYSRGVARVTMRAGDWKKTV